MRQLLQNGADPFSEDAVSDGGCGCSSDGRGDYGVDRGGGGCVTQHVAI